MMKSPEIEDLEQELAHGFKGDLRFDDLTQWMYSADASLYQIRPLGVIFPKDREDVVRVIRIATARGIPVLARGAGTSLAGQTVTPGLVVDCSRYMNRILEVNPRQRWARVEPGVVLDVLNDFLRFHGLFFAPDVATSSRATVGGMIGNNSAGTRSVRYGKTVDHVLEVDVVLSTGEEITFRSLTGRELEEKCWSEGREGTLHASVRAIVDSNREEIAARFPKVMRRVGGYNLDAMLDPNDFNLSRLIVGSEGTLAFVTAAKIRLEPIPKARGVCVVHFDDLIRAIDAVQPILQFNPSAVEILDNHGLTLARDNPAVSELCSRFIKDSPEAILMVEFSEDSEEAVRERVAQLDSDPEVRRLAYHNFIAADLNAQNAVWQVRKNALGVLLSMRGDAKPIPFVEDACIPVEHLSRYIRQILDMCHELGRPAALYAHASVGVIHVRPILNLKQKEDLEIMQEISRRAFELVQEYGGAWSGEHGDGLVRSYKNREFFGEDLYRAFQEVKRVFDPLGLMNPGKIIDNTSMVEHLRIHPGYHAESPSTFFRFEPEQGFVRAVEMCTGVGHCRKTLVGAMCPSYMATRNEEDSTRGRANALRAALTGGLGPEGLGSPRLYEVLDLCLECKACKSECPSNVDMARLKSEFLAHYSLHHPLPRSKRLFASLPDAARWAKIAPGLLNAVLGVSPVRAGLENWFGIDRRRRLPEFASRTFSSLWQKRGSRLRSGERVALFVDTYVEYFQPELGMATVGLLESLGYEVEPIRPGCCGRPLISSGSLARAKQLGLLVVSRLLPLAEQDIPIVVLEPSCLSALEDDYPDLIDAPQASRQVAAAVRSLEGFLAQPAVLDRLRKTLRSAPSELFFHPHCHQNALHGSGPTLKVLESLRDTRLVTEDSGCCGMAGGFGYEKAHYGISQKIGSRRLFPAIQKIEKSTPIVACGFSCRSQIEHFTGRQALHLAQLLAHSLEAG